MSATETISPGTNLINLLLALLAPMFLWSTAGDIRLAHIAAAETLREYRVTNRLSLLMVAKIIAFDIATLSSLSQSMYEDVSISLALRLRGNANSLDRSGERNRLALEAFSHSAADAGADASVGAEIAQAEQMVRDGRTRVHADGPGAPEPAAAPVAPGAASLDACTPAEPPQPAWSDAMTTVADELAAGLDNVPPEQRWGRRSPHGPTR
jgi:uncharacterized protein YbjQ (UPF0145 family)